MFRIAFFFVAVPATEDNGRLHVTSLFCFPMARGENFGKGFPVSHWIGRSTGSRSLLHPGDVGLVFLHSPMNGETWWSLPHSGMENFDKSFGVSSCLETPEAGAQCESSYATAWRTRGVSWAALQLLGGAGTKQRTLIETAQTSLDGSPWQTQKFNEFESLWYLLKNSDTILCDWRRLGITRICTVVGTLVKRSPDKCIYSLHFSISLYPILELAEFALLKLYTNLFRTIHSKLRGIHQEGSFETNGISQMHEAASPSAASVESGVDEMQCRAAALHRELGVLEVWTPGPLWGGWSCLEI